MFRLAAVLAQQPRLRAVISLRPFPEGSLPGFVDEPSNSFETSAARVEVTWGSARTYSYHRDLNSSAEQDAAGGEETPCTP